MYFGLFIILIPMIVGYYLPKPPSIFVQGINRMLNRIVYIILFFMGICLACLPNLCNSLRLVSVYVFVSALCILTMNVIALGVLEKNFPWKGLIAQPDLSSPPPRFHWWRIAAINSLQLCTVIICGFIVGLTHWPYLNQAMQVSKLLLVLLLCLVGIQLRHSGMTIKQIIVNRRGMVVALVVAISALIGGALAAILLGLPLRTGLALASAYGWYSLSGILMTEAFGAVIGSTAFFNDLLREFLAMIFIPSLMQHRRNTALGLCGATSMDVTLPILQRSGGLEIVPAAIVHGFILSLLAPLLISLFSIPISS